MLTATGTLQYKAPQMFTGGGYTEMVDSWAVGVSLYEMITGVTPFQTDKEEYLQDIIHSILHKEINMQYGALKGSSPLLKDLIWKLLQRDPNKRLTCE